MKIEEGFAMIKAMTDPTDPYGFSDCVDSLIGSPEGFRYWVQDNHNATPKEMASKWRQDVFDSTHIWCEEIVNNPPYGWDAAGDSKEIGTYLVYKIGDAYPHVNSEVGLMDHDDATEDISQAIITQTEEGMCKCFVAEIEIMYEDLCNT